MHKEENEMNMLTNEIPFGLLSDEDKILFRNLKPDELLCFQNIALRYDWHYIGDTSREALTYRLKLKEGAFYYLEWNDKSNGVFEFKDDNYLVEICEDNPSEWRVEQVQGIPIFHPATQEEIDSVTPQETYVDVVISWTNANGYPHCKHPSGSSGTYTFSNYPVGQVFSGWILSAYIHEFKGIRIDNFPILWNEEGTKIVSKAIHARFVKFN